jgi:hypothetical protein
MIKVYIAGPYRGCNAWVVENNIRRAEAAAMQVMASSGLDYGSIPNMVAVCPHSMYRYFDGTLTQQFWLDATEELLRVCDIVYVFGRSEGSAGTTHEIRVAERLGIPVCRSLDLVWEAAQRIYQDTTKVDSKL